MAQVATRRGKVVRAFYYDRKPLKIGEVVTLPRVFALEMEAAKKLELIDDAPASKTGGKKEGE
jgi:hypothetical protein